MKELQYFKDELAKLPEYGYVNWNDMILSLSGNEHNRDIIAQRLALATFNYAAQFTSKESVLEFISNSI